MAKYTQTEADDMVDVTKENPGKGWKTGETYCSGCNTIDPDGEPIVVGRGWRFDMVNFEGRPLEILVDLPENEPEVERHKAAKDKIKTLDVIDCDIYPPA